MRFDLFQGYRFVLAVFTTTYAVLQTLHMLRTWALSPLPSRHFVTLRRYAVVLLLRTRTATLVPPLLEILFWLVTLAILIRLHPG